MKSILNYLFCLFLITSSTLSFAQSSIFSDIHSLESIKAHYKDLSVLPAKAKPNDPLNSISFQPEKYNAYAILYTMAEPAYLSKSQIDQMVSALAFPANSSKQTQAELAFMLDLKNKRTPQQKERVMNLAKIGYWPPKSLIPTHPEYESNLNHLLFECQEVMGDDCTIANYPMTVKLLQGVTMDMRIMEFTAKYHLLRPRPYQLEPNLDPLQIMGSPSFASGHTLWAYIHAFTYSELIPEKRKAFLDLAFEIGLSREIMGIHYPSDEEASRQLAHRMLSLMWQTEKFQTDFLKAKAEWD